MRDALLNCLDFTLIPGMPSPEDGTTFCALRRAMVTEDWNRLFWLLCQTPNASLKLLSLWHIADHYHGCFLLSPDSLKNYISYNNNRRQRTAYKALFTAEMSTSHKGILQGVCH